MVPFLKGFVPPTIFLSIHADPSQIKKLSLLRHLIGPHLPILSLSVHHYTEQSGSEPLPSAFSALHDKNPIIPTCQKNNTKMFMTFKFSHNLDPNSFFDLISSLHSSTQDTLLTHLLSHSLEPPDTSECFYLLPPPLGRLQRAFHVNSPC